MARQLPFHSSHALAPPPEIGGPPTTRPAPSVSEAAGMERLVTAIKRLFVLLCGFEIIPKTISTRDRGERFIISRIDNTSFSIQWMNGEDVDGSDVFESGGLVHRCYAHLYYVCLQV